MCNTARPLPPPPRLKSVPPAILRSAFSLEDDGVQVLERTSDYLISTWRSVMFLAWRGPETTTGIVRSRSLMQPWATRRHGGVVLVVLMPPKATLKYPPSQEVRMAIANVSRDASDSFRGIAIIGNERGFIGSVVRSVMTTRQVVVRNPVPFKMFSSAAEAAPWLTRCLDLQEDLQHEFVASVGRARWQ